jgi:hypothetical protein
MDIETYRPILGFLLTIPVWAVGLFGLWVAVAARHEERITRIASGCGGITLILIAILLLVNPGTGIVVLIAVMFIAGGLQAIWAAQHHLDNSFLWPRFLGIGPRYKPFSQRLFSEEHIMVYRRIRSYGCGGLILMAGLLLLMSALFGAAARFVQ